MRHLKTIGIMVGAILAFIILLGAGGACFGFNNTFTAICLIIFIVFLLVQAYISIYKHLK
jgi:hypothetical protein